MKEEGELTRKKSSRQEQQMITQEKDRGVEVQPGKGAPVKTKLHQKSDSNRPWQANNLNHDKTKL